MTKTGEGGPSATQNQPASESLWALVPQSMRGPLVNIIVSVPVLSVGLYIFGRRFTRQLYWRFGIDDSVLSLSVQDYVIRSEGAFLRVVGSLGWFYPVVGTVIWLFLGLVAKWTRRSKLGSLALAAVACAAFVIAAASAPDDADLATASLWYFGLFAVIGVRAAVHFVDNIAPALSKRVVHAGAAVALAVVVVAVLTEGAAREGRRHACLYDHERHRSQPVSIVSNEPLYVGSMTVVGERFMHHDLRLFNRTSAGYLVFETTASPSNSGMALIPSEQVVTLQFRPDHTPALADPGDECRSLLALD